MAKLSHEEIQMLIEYYKEHGLLKTAEKYNMHYTKIRKLLNKHNVRKIKGGSQTNICIDCKRSARFIEFPCSWAHKFQPVEGWTATEVKYKDGPNILKTYKITQCPLFMEDDFRNTETCVCCGAEIPEGRQVCPKCENKYSAIRYRRRAYK